MQIVDTEKVGQIPSSIIVEWTNCEPPINQKPSRVCVNARGRLSDQARYICLWTPSLLFWVHASKMWERGNIMGMPGEGGLSY